MAFRNYLTGIIFVVLLIWGPINYTLPAWILIRIGYLIIIPLIVRFLLKSIWNYWQPNIKLEIALERMLASLICLTLLILAVLEVISETHIGNTHWIRGKDGMEAVGDDIVLPGPDWGNAFILLIIATIIFWYGVLKKVDKTP